MELKGFDASRCFYDDVSFPRGFRKCGDFSIVEAEALHKYGHSLLALHQGVQEPVTTEEKRFVEVCQGKREPSSLIEKVWVKYQSKLNNQIVVSAFGNVSATKQEAENDSSSRLTDSEIYE